MNKGDLIEKIAKDARINKAEAGRAIDSLIDGVKKSLKKGERVSLVGFGTYTVSRRKAREGRNPQTGAPIRIPAKNVPKFLPGKELKKAIQ
ncbi:MAG: HU family DNA-binding protein [Acidobacteria bacterium]|nr:HU family DNA-binding protein [Acidobacteriota bacterium]